MSASASLGETGELVARDEPRAWYLAGVVMVNCSLVYLIVLGDLAGRAYIDGSFASRGLAIHLGAASAVFMAAALLGALIIRRHSGKGRQVRHRCP
jgi:hypothetical protein